MKPVVWKSSFLGFAIVAIASLGGALTACSAPNQATSTQSSPTATPAGNSAMDHGNMGSMNHTMGMDLGPADAQFDLRFIDAMTPHHQGAVQMAKEAMQKAQHPEIKKLATRIIQAQDQEIALMKQWRQAWYPKASADDAQMGHTMPMSENQRSMMMMSKDLGAADAQFDLRFINAMIPHHQGAVTMAEDAQSKSKRPEIQKLAKEILVSQKAEISQMEQWRNTWYKI